MGRATSYSYNADQWQTGIDYPNGTSDVTYSYDPAGNLLSMVDGLGTTTYAYDVLNRLTQRTRNGRTVGYELQFQNDQVTQIGYWGRGNVQYSYDDASRATSMTPWGAAPTSYSYRSTGWLTSISRGNGTTTSFGYDSASRLTSLLHDQGATPLRTSSTCWTRMATAPR